MTQLEMFSSTGHARPDRMVARSGSFGDNMKLPFHRWFRYSAGYSAEWAQGAMRDVGLGPGCRVLDPFVGSGTTLIAAREEGVSGVGVEAHPFVSRIARAKLTAAAPGDLLACAREFIRMAAQQELGMGPQIAPLLSKCYAPDALTGLLQLREAFRIVAPTLPDPLRNLLWLAVTAILRECSGVGTAQWQYVLPNKTKARIKEPLAAFRNRVELFAHDLGGLSPNLVEQLVLDGDARTLEVGRPVDMVLTSPPYPNNYDYADATRLEMTFWGEVATWSDLHASVRHGLICACSQHSAAERLDLTEVLARPELAPIKPELSAVTQALAQLRLTRAGRKSYDTMVACYFSDLALTWRSLRAVLRPGGRAVFVVGDSAPYGVHVPVERWLGELALAAGFKSFAFVPLRERNTKWKNRKHRVPLVEGVLTVEG